MLGCKPATTPMDSTNNIRAETGHVGRLIYLSLTRHDIGFLVSVVSQFMNNPTKEHVEVVIRKF